MYNGRGVLERGNAPRPAAKQEIRKIIPAGRKSSERGTDKVEMPRERKGSTCGQSRKTKNKQHKAAFE